MKLPGKSVIATLIGAGVLGALPWIAMTVIKTGAVGASSVIAAIVFIAMAAGAMLQWWVNEDKT